MPTLELKLPSGKTPTLQLYNTVAVGSPIAGVATVNPCIYTFDLTGVASGDYSYRLVGPEGAGRIRVSSSAVIRLDSFSTAFRVAIQVNSGLVAVANALVVIQQSGLIVGWSYADTNGLAVFYLQAGSYTVDVSATGFASIVADALPVTANATITKSLSQSSIDPPATLSVCRVLVRSRAGAIPKATRVKITCGGSGRQSDIAFMSTAFDGSTDGTGMIQVDLPWSSRPGVGQYRFQFMDPSSGALLHDRSVTVPDQATANYEDLT